MIIERIEFIDKQLACLDCGGRVYLHYRGTEILLR